MYAEFDVRHERYLLEQNNSTDVLFVFICSGWELREQLQWRHSLDVASALPQRGGSWLQARKLENFYSERLSILQEERVHTK